MDFVADERRRYTKKRKSFIQTIPNENLNEQV